MAGTRRRSEASTAGAAFKTNSMKEDWWATMACSSAGVTDFGVPADSVYPSSAPSSVVSSPIHHYPVHYMAGGAAGGGGAVARRANLEFPPPPSYPPPLKAENPDYRLYYHKALVHHAPRDYSYAYNHPSRTGSPIACSAALVRLAQQHPQEYQLIQQQQEYQQLLQQQQEELELLEAAECEIQQQQRKEQQQKNYQMVQAYHLHRMKQQQDPHKRHTYVTRYGTEENIYEEISEIRWATLGVC